MPGAGPVPESPRENVQGKTEPKNGSSQGQSLALTVLFEPEALRDLPDRERGLLRPTAMREVNWAVRLES